VGRRGTQSLGRLSAKWFQISGLGCLGQRPSESHSAEIRSIAIHNNKPSTSDQHHLTTTPPIVALEPHRWVPVGTRTTFSRCRAPSFFTIDIREGEAPAEPRLHIFTGGVPTLKN